MSTDKSDHHEISSYPFLQQIHRTYGGQTRVYPLQIDAHCWPRLIYTEFHGTYENISNNSFSQLKIPFILVAVQIVASAQKEA